MALKPAVLQSDFILAAGQLDGTIRWTIPDFKNWIASRNSQDPILSPLIEIKTSPASSVMLKVSSEGSVSSKYM